MIPGSPIQRVADLIRSWTGIDVPPYRHALLESELRRLAGGGPLEAGVAGVLDGDADAREAVIEVVSIPETYLFRTSDHFAALASLARQRLEAGGACRVLSAGASTGEEAWSAAAVLASVYPVDGPPHSVTGWELNPGRVLRARRGRFGPWAARQGLFGYDAHFEMYGDVFVARPRLRRLVTFEEINLVDLEDASVPRFDAVFFRNVSIYWNDAALVARVQRLLGELVVPDGLLMLGPSDPVRLGDGWRVHEVGRACVHRRAERSLMSAPAATGPAAAVRGAKPPVVPVAAPARVIDGAPTREAPAPARVVDRAPTREAPAAPDAVLAEIRALADAGRTDEALARLNADHALPVSSRRFWEGVIRLSQGRFAEATTALTESVFHAPNEPTYRRWLALALESTGRTAEAERERRNARALEAA